VKEPYPDSDTASSHVARCLSDWSLEGKLISVTIKHPVSQLGRENLRYLLRVKNQLIINGKLLLENSCAADVFSAGQEIIEKIRKRVKNSESQNQKFLQVASENSLSLDNQAQWITTYEMPVAASGLKEAFSCLKISDPDDKEVPSMETGSELTLYAQY
jgi:hypothetical protein